MSAHAVDHFSWFQKIEPLSHYPDYILHAALVALLLIGSALLVTGKLRKTREQIIPDNRLTLKNLFELVTEFVLDLMRGLLGDQAPKYLPLIGSVFIYVLVCNIIGLIPGFQPPTTSLNTNLGVSITVFLYYQVMGFREHGFAYLKHFMGPIWWLGPLIFLIEIVGHVVRPISLALRLGGNMMGDHTVLNIFSSLIPIGVPVIFLGLGLFVCFIQAFVFSLLSTIYLSLAVAHDH